MEQKVESGCPSASSEPSGEGQQIKRRRKRKRPSSGEFDKETDTNEPFNKRPVADGQGVELETNSAADRLSEATGTLKKVVERNDSTEEGRTDKHESPQLKCSLDVQKLRVMSK